MALSSQSRLFSAESKESRELNEIKTEILKDFGRYIESLLKVETSHFRVRAQGVLTSIKAATSSLDIYAILEGQRIIFLGSSLEISSLSELNVPLLKSQLPLFLITPSSIPPEIDVTEPENKKSYCDLVGRSLKRIPSLEKLKKQGDAEKFAKGFQKMKENVLSLFDNFKEVASYKDRVSDIRSALEKATEITEISAILENQKEIFKGEKKLTDFGDILKNVNILYKGYSVNFLNLDLKKDPYYQLILASETVFQNFTSNPLGENQFLRLGNR